MYMKMIAIELDEKEILVFALTQFIKLKTELLTREKKISIQENILTCKKEMNVSDLETYDNLENFFDAKNFESKEDAKMFFRVFIKEL